MAVRLRRHCGIHGEKLEAPTYIQLPHHLVCFRRIRVFLLRFLLCLVRILTLYVPFRIGVFELVVDAVRIWTGQSANVCRHLNGRD